MNCVHLVHAGKTHIILHSCEPTAARKIFLLLIIFDWLAVERNRSDCGGKSKHTFTVCLFFYCQATLFTLRDNDCEQITGVPACVRSFIPSHHSARLTRWQVYYITAIFTEVRSQYKCRNYISFFFFILLFFSGSKAVSRCQLTKLHIPVIISVTFQSKFDRGAWDSFQQGLPGVAALCAKR